MRTLKSPMARFDLLIFDLDGTVIDSQEDICDAVVLTMKTFDLTPVSRQIIRRHIGTGVRPLLRSKFAEAADQRIDAALHAFDDIYALQSTVKTRPYPGIVDVLENFAEVTKVILTNKSSKFVDPILSSLGIARYFSHTFGREAFSETKPSPLPIKMILEKFDSAKKAVIIGDTPTDIVAGKAAGISTCGVLYGYGAPDAIMQAEPDAVARLPNSLLSIIS